LKIQDKYGIINKLISDLFPTDENKEIQSYWEDLTNWLNNKKFFGEFGYDFENKCFRVEPDLPGQQFLFNERIQSENDTEQARLQVDEGVKSLPGKLGV
jgi:hypothetical protein